MSRWKVSGWPPATEFCGVVAAQTRNDFWLWEDFFRDFKVKLMIELGSYRGGLSLFLLCQCLNRGIEFFTVDRQLPEAAVGPLGNILKLGRHYKEQDLLSGSQWLIDTIKAPENHPLALYCDNGNKPEEVKLYGPHLRADDYLIVHDWNVEINIDDILESDVRVETLMEKRCNRERSLTRFFRIL